ncbi:MAG: hypothetical protein VX944_04910, partial [Myxococcota bacterium]|nr:hypothetical protein [Myxococcota bacterium]
MKLIKIAMAIFLAVVSLYALKSFFGVTASTVTTLMCGGEHVRNVSALDPDFRTKVVRIMDDLRKAGFELQVSSAYRSQDHQQCLYRLSRFIEKYTSRSGFTKLKWSC